MKGTRKSYDLLESFILSHSIHPKFGKISIDYFIWTSTKSETIVAIELETQLIKKFGILKNYDDSRALAAKLMPFENYQQTASINPDLSALEIMDYLDDLGPLRKLHPRPPINAVVSARFYIPGAELYSESEDYMASRMLAWLSPTSNSVSYSLQFPCESLSDKFEHAKQKFEDGCGVKLEDKYFWLRTRKPNDKWTFKKLYSKDIGSS